VPLFGRQISVEVLGTPLTHFCVLFLQQNALEQASSSCPQSYETNKATFWCCSSLPIFDDADQHHDVLTLFIGGRSWSGSCWQPPTRFIQSSMVDV